MKYEIVWSAVDNLAKTLGLSPSGLAKKAGLDSTTFNKSKRVRPDGKCRWPSLDSVNKVLEFCNISFEDFYKYGDNAHKSENLNAIPFIRYNHLNHKKIVNGPEIDTSSWEKVSFPDGARNLYAIELDSNDFAPLYKFGTTLVLAKSSDIRRGDRIAVYMADKSIILAEFSHRKPQTLELCDLNNPEKFMSVAIDQTKLVSRIIWASQ